METHFDGGSMEQRMMAAAAAQQMPLSGSMELTPLCNMNCRMCYVRLSPEEMKAQGRLRTTEEWLALGEEMARAGTLFLLLTGGEPLTHPGFKEIYLGLRRMGMVLTVNTNATLIDEDWISFFALNKPRRINITLYGVDPSTYDRLCHYPGGFDRVIQAVKRLRARNVDVRLGFSVTPQNHQELQAFYALAKELDCAVISDTYMAPCARERSEGFDQQSRLQPEEAAKARVNSLLLEDNGKSLDERIDGALAQIDAFVPEKPVPCESSCMAGRCSFTINWQGMMRPCVLASEPEENVFECGFFEAWKQVSRAFLAVRYCAECSVCSVRSLCKVCPVACKLETGDYMACPEYLCRYAKKTEQLLRNLMEETHGKNVSDR